MKEDSNNTREFSKLIEHIGMIIIGFESSLPKSLSSYDWYDNIVKGKIEGYKECLSMIKELSCKIKWYI